MRPDIIFFFAGWTLGDWVWCRHCERCYQVGEFRVVGELQMCPYAGCSGSAVLDCWHWESVASMNGYPNVPERDTVYPLYGGVL